MRNTRYISEPSGAVKHKTVWFVFTGTASAAPLRIQGHRRALRALQHARAGDDVFSPVPVRPHLRAIRSLQHTPEPAPVHLAAVAEPEAA